MSAFSKAAVQNVGIGADLNVCFWPKADIRGGLPEPELNGGLGEKSGRLARGVGS